MVKCLRRHWNDARVITADSKPQQMVTASLLSDAHFQTPPVEHPEFAEALGHILDAEKITDYIPLHDAEFAAAERVQPHQPLVSIWSNPLFAPLATDKIEAQNWLEALGLPIPRRYDIGTLPDRGNLFSKPRRGHASRDAMRQPVTRLRSLPPSVLDGLILQEVCSGPEITVDSFYDAATGIHRAVARERLAVRSGICTQARVYEDDFLSGCAQRIGMALGQRGTICFQVMRNSRGWAIIDLNLRPGAGTAMTTAAGVDLLGAMAACRWGEPYGAMIDHALPEEGVYVTRQYAEFVTS